MSSNEKLVCDTYSNSVYEEQLEAWMELSDYMCNSPTCAGLSNHALIICRK